MNEINACIECNPIICIKHDNGRIIADIQTNNWFILPTEIENCSTRNLRLKYPEIASYERFVREGYHPGSRNGR